MSKLTQVLVVALVVSALPISLAAQPPRRPRDDDARPSAAGGTKSVVTRMMAFDKNNDGKLAKDEVTDSRLLRLFHQADANQDGVVTQEELTSLAKRMDAESDAGGQRGGPDGPGGRGPGGPGGRGPGGPGEGDRRGPPPDDRGPGDRGPGGPADRPRPGQILSPGLQDALELTANQIRLLQELQSEVDARLAKILTEKQKAQLERDRERGGERPNRPGEEGPPRTRPAGRGE